MSDSDSDEENSFDYDEFLCLMRFPCAVCCGYPSAIDYYNSAMKNPSDAEKLSEEEATIYINQMQGIITNKSNTIKKYFFFTLFFYCYGRFIIF